VKIYRQKRNRAYFRYVRKAAIRRKKYINKHIFLNNHDYYDCDGKYDKGKVSRRKKTVVDRRNKIYQLIETQQLAEIV